MKKATILVIGFLLVVACIVTCVCSTETVSEPKASTFAKEDCTFVLSEGLLTKYASNGQRLAAIRLPSEAEFVLSGDEFFLFEGNDRMILVKNETMEIRHYNDILRYVTHNEGQYKDLPLWALIVELPDGSQGHLTWDGVEKI